MNRAGIDGNKTYPTFPNAPIVEAVLDIKVGISEAIELSDLEALHNDIKGIYPGKRARVSFRGNFAFSGKEGESSLSSTSKPDGFLFDNESKNKVVQARLDGFSFNRLKPYASWSEFSSEARLMWDHYVKAVGQLKVKQLGLRYINRIELPMPFGDFGEFILTNPQIAPGIPQSISQFFMRMEIPYPELPGIAIVIVAMEKPTKAMRLPLILDIDVVKKTDYERDVTKIWEDFERMRHIKNEIFFDSLTEKAKELFQ